MTRPAFRPLLTWLEDRTTPAASFAAQQTFGVGTSPFQVAAGDVNGDGRPDVATANSTTNNVSVLLNTTAPGAASAAFAAKQDFAVGSGPQGVALADVNADGRLDLIGVNLSDSNVSVFLNTTPLGAATLTLAAKQDFTVGSGPLLASVGDVTGDGRPDIVVTNSNAGTVSVLVNTTAAGTATPTFAAKQDFTVGAGPFEATVGDVNGDGRGDLVVVNGNSTTVSVLLNTTPPGNATATFAAQQTFTVGTAPTSATLGDINGDGRPDITTANFTSNTVSVLVNTTAAGATTPTFAAQVTFAAGANPNGAVVIDVTGDGRPDIVAVNNGSNNVSVLENTTPVGAGTPTFSAAQNFTVGANPRQIAAGDFNRDGRPDIVATNSGAGNVSVLMNNLAPYAVGNAAVIADQGRLGVSRFNRVTGAFAPLGPGQVDKVAAGPNGSFVANYPGFGVWLYRPTTGFTQINGFDAAALAMDPNGNVFVSFVGFGTFRFLLANGQYQQIDARVASLLAADGQGNVAANFPGAGVWLRRGGGAFAQINGFDARALAVDFYGNVFVSFNGFGTFNFTLATNQFQQIDTRVASQLATDGRGNVVANFPGAGVWLKRGTAAFTQINGIDPRALAVDAFGNVLVSFAGFGTYEFRLAGGGPVQLSATAATVLAVGR